MAEFSYQADIAPLRSQFFPVTNVRAQDVRALNTDYLKNIAPLEQQSLKLLGEAQDDLRKSAMMQDYETRREIQAQQLETMQFKFKQDKEQAQAEMEAADLLSGLDDTLRAFDDPTDKQAAFLQFTADNPQVMKSAVGRTTMQLYGQAIASDRAAQQRQKDRMLDAAIRTKQFGVVEALNENTITPQAAAQQLGLGLAAEKEAEAAQKEQKRLSETYADMLEYRKSPSLFTTKTNEKFDLSQLGTNPSALDAILANAAPEELRLKTQAYDKLLREMQQLTGKDFDTLDEMYEDDHALLYREHGDILSKRANVYNPIPSEVELEIGSAIRRR